VQRLLEELCCAEHHACQLLSNARLDFQRSARVACSAGTTPRIRTGGQAVPTPSGSTAPGPAPGGACLENLSLCWAKKTARAVPNRRVLAVAAASGPPDPEPEPRSGPLFPSLTHAAAASFAGLLCGQAALFPRGKETHRIALGLNPDPSSSLCSSSSAWRAPRGPMSFLFLCCCRPFLRDRTEQRQYYDLLDVPQVRQRDT
jgi:hypothetical protein